MMDQKLCLAFRCRSLKAWRRKLLSAILAGTCLLFGVKSSAQFDLALKLTLSPGQPDTVSYGETVTFQVTVYNQGALPAYSILVLDYLPADVTFNAAQNSGWNNFGAGPAWLIPGPLAPGASISKNIKLVVTNQAMPGFINNYAEITTADDDLNSGNTPPADADSTPNAFLFDDPGGQPGSPSDNVITGNGTGAPGSNDPATDEDDHDGEAVVLYVPSLTLGNFVWHDVNNNGLFDPNETGIDAVEIVLFKTTDTIIGNFDDAVIDFASTGNGGFFEFANLQEGYYFLLLANGIPENMVSSTGGGPYDLDGAGPFEPGIDGDVNGADHGSQEGQQVISGIFELFYETEPTNDGDTDWNTNLTADFGLYEPQPLPTLSIGNLVFYDLDNDGFFNNNDYGLEGVEVVLIDAGADELAGTADDQALDSTLTNSAGEYLFTGLAAGFYFVKLNGVGIPPGFVSSTGGGPNDMSGTGPFEPSNQADVNNTDHGTQALAEVISSVVELAIDSEPVNDGDADPNTNLAIDFGLYLPLPLFDLALQLELLTQSVLTQGDSATLWVSIFNQSEAPAESVLLTVRNPSGSVWDDPATSYLNDTTAAVLLSVQNGLLPPGGLLPGEMVTLPLNLYILPGFTGNALTVLAEISNATGENGQILIDLDSTPDDDFTNDIIGGDNVIDNTNNDEDDHDYAYLPVNQTFDISLQKSLAPGQPTSVSLGGEVQYFIKITNEGDLPVANVLVFDYLPAGMILSPNDLHWTSISADTAAYTFSGPIAPGASDSVAILLKIQYGASGAALTNLAEIQGVTDASGNIIPDNDSTPANSQTGEDDQGEAPVEIEPHDPTGWIYCDKTGKVITGGSISVTGPNGIPNDQVILIEDGSNGYYEFFTDGTPGVYTITYSHPSGYPLSVNCLPGTGPYDPTGMPDPVTLGVDTTGMYLSDTACASNPYYLEFDLEPGDPFIFLNNIPVQCAAISSVVCEDTNHNDTGDAGDTPIAGATVYLYDCSNLGVAIDSVLSDAQGRYTFDGLTPGDYLVGYVIPGGYRIVAGGPINTFGFSNCFTLNWGDCDTSKFICIYECPVVDAGPEVTICAGDTTQLQAATPWGGGNFTWSPAVGLSDPAIANPLAFPSDSMAYSVVYDDGIGCISSDSVSVFVQTTTPVLTYTPFTDSTVECGSPLPFDAPQFSDACDTMLTVALDSIITPQPCGYLLERTWTATNSQGNSTDFTQIVTVTDTTPPTMSANHVFFGNINHGDTLYADCTQIPSLDSLGFSAVDACSATTVNFTENITQGNCDVDGFVEWRYCGWTAADACGNLDSLFFTVIARDTTPPALTGVPADVTVECFNIPDTAMVTVSDACDTLVNLTFGETFVPAFNGCDSLIIRTWSAMDDCGNFVEASQTITVIDTTPPVMSANHVFFGNINHGDTLYADCTQIPLLDSLGFSAFDLCSATTVTFTENVMPGSCDVEGYFELRHCGWTATDACGNTDSLFFMVIVSDTVPPVLSAYPANASYGCLADVPAAPVLTATDNCDTSVTVVFVETTTGNPAGCNFEITRMWTATDDCGNTDIAEQTILVNDTLPPVLSAYPADASYGCLSDVPAAPVLTATDNCDTTVSVIFVETTTGNPAGCSFEITRTWTATDECGNTDVAEQTILVNDTVPPVLSAHPADASYGCLSDIPTAPVLTATDNCDTSVTVVFVETTTGNPAGCNFEITRTWTATDDCGNTDIAEQTILVNDTVPPVLSAYPANASYGCLSDVPVAPVLTATDNCDTSVTVVFVEMTIGNPAGCNFEITRTWTATDECGNTDIAEQTILVNDTIPPVLSAYPPDASYGCLADVPIAPVLTATDNCDTSVTVVFVETTIGNPAGCNFEITRTWTASDDCGNQTVWEQNIMVNDTVPPLLSDYPPDASYGCLSDVPAAPVLTAADNCDTSVTVVFVETTTGDPAGCNFEITRTWTATDDCGNTDVAEQTILVNDTLPPVLSAYPVDASYGCLSDVPAAPVLTATDNCDTSVTVVFVETTTGDPAGCNFEITRTWTVSDDCGNQIIWEQNIMVNDTVPPTLSLAPASLTLSCETPIPPAPTLTATDNCDPDVQVDFTETYFGDTTSGCHLRFRTWTATDDCGNTATATQFMMVTDFTPPTLHNVPPNQTVSCENVPGNVVTATDNCDPDVPVSISDVVTADANGCISQIKRTWTAADDCGNIAFATRTFFITNDDAPVITITNPMMAGVSDGDTLYLECQQVIGLTADDVSATADCCGTPAITFYENISASGDCQASGYLQVMHCGWVATDCCGNTDSLFFTVIVSDNTAPLLLGVPGDTTLSCGGNVPPPANVQGLDNCDHLVTVTYAADTITSDSTIQIIRTWMAVDACGNAASDMQVITVGGDQAPNIFNVPANLTVYSPADVPPPASNIILSDDCDPNPQLFFNEEKIGSGNCCYELIRTWTAVDFAGNSNSSSQFITVVDTVAPVISGVPANLAVDCEWIELVAPSVSVSDNCAVNPALTVSLDTTFSSCGFTITRTWTATDECGNSTFASQTITVSDTDAPVLSGVPVGFSVACGEPVPAPPTVTATDNCAGNVPVNFTETQQGSGCSYQIIRTWTAADACGNLSSASQTIMVSDDLTPPLLAGVPADVTVDCNNVPSPATVTATDNCSTAAVSMNETTNSNCPQIITRTWTAVDDCGNSVYASQTITVNDTQPPVLTAAPADLTVSCGSDVPVAVALTATDNCTDSVAVVFGETMTGDACSFVVTRTWTATDDCGNTAVRTQKITVSDTEPPVLTNTPADVTVACDAIPQPANVTATDNCDDNVTLLFDETTNGSSCAYTIERTWMATDNCGNGTSFTQIITVNDTEPPVLTNTPADVTVACDAIPQPANVTASDNCDDNVTLFFDETTSGSGCAYTIERTWTATDNCGNGTSFTQIITVNDTEPPVLTNTPADVTVACDAIPQPANVTATDNCDDNVTILFNETTSGSGCAYTIERTWTATDNCDNGTSFTQIITVEDNTAPAFAFVPANVTVDCGGTVPAFGDPIAEDDCSGVLLTFVTDSIVTVGGYDLTRTWTAADSCGNSTTASQIISVTTGGAPVLHGVPNDTTIFLASGGVVPDPVNVTATEGCDSTAMLPVIFDESKSTSGCDTILVRTWSATGSGGQTVSDSQTITVVVELQIAVSTTPDTCGTGDGTAVLTPDTYSYIWSDGGSGASRTGLSAGTYTVTATSGSCSTTLQVVVGSVCPCDQAVVNSVNIIEPTCGNYDGSVTIDLAQDEADYKFHWLPMFGTPNADGNSRTGLPAGHYFVYIVLKSNNSCVEKLEFDLVEDCSNPVGGGGTTHLTSPAGIFSEKTAVVSGNCMVTDLGYCLDIPFDELGNYSFEVNGQPYQGGFGACGFSDTLAFLHLPDGFNTVVATRPGLKFSTDTIEVLVACVTPDVFEITIDAGETETILFDTDELPGGTPGISMLVDPEANPAASFEILTSETGIRVTGLRAGESNASVVICDEFGVCDSNFIRVSVRWPEELGGPIVSGEKPATERLGFHNGFSPNGDGLNDFFKIEGLEQYPDHQLSIFTRWGSLVFRTRDYRNDWGGSWNSNNLPDGTYFYLLDDGAGGRYSGFVEVRR